MNNDDNIRLLKEFIHEVLLEHCTCGTPDHSEKSMKYIQRLLNLLNDSNIGDSDALNRFFHYEDGLKHMIYYMLDKYGLTKHGDFTKRNLTEDGHHLLKKLNQLYPKASY